MAPAWVLAEGSGVDRARVSGRWSGEPEWSVCCPLGRIGSEAGGSSGMMWSGGGRFAGCGPAEDGKGSTVGRKRRRGF